jgi:outer membrane protein OmpA-like peptidoglycan-associated protein
MKARYSGSLASITCAMLAFSSAQAADLMTGMPTAADFIEALAPQPVAKTRGIRPKGDAGVAPAPAASAYAPAAPAYASAAPAPAPSAPGVDLPVVTFEFNSAQLTAQARQVLDQLSSALRSQDLAGSRILIEGHTDTVGGVEYNLGLSKQRAESVGRYLASQQIDPGRLQMLGKGESEPLDADGTAAVNRRVRVVNIGS